MTQTLPKTVDDISALDEAMTRPTPGLVEMMDRLEGDITILGVGGKMGPTLAALARRADDEAGVKRQIVGVSRFSSSEARKTIENCGVKTIACDLLDPEQLERLPKAQNVVYMAGMKFGAISNEPLTWAMNTYLPGMVAQHFKASRIVALSTGNVYPFGDIEKGGSKESDPTGPVGEYAQSCLGRERVFHYWAEKTKTPVLFFRLNYAVDLRYGVLLDIASKIQSDQPVDVSTGHLNFIWQGDANAAVLESFEHVGTPPKVLNVTGKTAHSVRELAHELGRRLGREPIITGTEEQTALLSDASLAHQLLSPPTVSTELLLDWTAHWVKISGSTLDKPTHFETRDGKF